jgi:hypothetical protein
MLMVGSLNEPRVFAELAPMMFAAFLTIILSWNTPASVTTCKD